MIKKLDHINLVTADLFGAVSFYTKILGLETGWRPDFDVPGAWLYANQLPIVHLVDRHSDLSVGRIEHFALQGDDIETFLSHLQRNSVANYVNDIPSTDCKSVNLHDPDGNHIEVIFGDMPFATS